MQPDEPQPCDSSLYADMDVSMAPDDPPEEEESPSDNLHLDDCDRLKARNHEAPRTTHLEAPTQAFDYIR